MIISATNSKHDRHKLSIRIFVKSSGPLQSHCRACHTRTSTTISLVHLFTHSSALASNRPRGRRQSHTGVKGNTQQTVDSSNTLLNTMHPDTPNNLTTILASFLWKRNECDGAKEASHKALEGFKKGLDPNHRGTLECVSVLASLQAAQEKYEAAEEMYWWLLKAYGKLGRNGTQTVSIARKLVPVLSAQGKHEAEEEMRRLMLKTYEEVLGKQHSQTLKNLSELASVLRVQGKYDAAGVTKRSLLERQVQALAAHHNF
jgi:tetratricopeptide (TPR) repeat protein